ncbi:hypothetical protein SEPCBS57363_006481 [Sporothrix epigloea]|uniref:Uncharacterized protein n=1 Tax=Sporothrix epigloea TaxID=1892477 RepID=A0ABP0E6G1_9PEZI
MPYTITEPHPTVQANAYTHSGRGGLGNIFRAPTSVTPSSGIPTSFSSSSSSSASRSGSSGSTRFYAGRGGAGNVYPISERQGVSLDDEFAYASAVATSAVRGHVGRGGAGNVISVPSSSVSALKTDQFPATSGQSTADKMAQSIRLGLRRQSDSSSHSHGDYESKPRKGSDASFMSDASFESDASMSSTRRSGFWNRTHRGDESNKEWHRRPFMTSGSLSLNSLQGSV